MTEPQEPFDLKPAEPEAPRPPTDVRPVLNYRPPQRYEEIEPDLSTGVQGAIGFCSWILMIFLAFGYTNFVSRGNVGMVLIVACVGLLVLGIWLRLRYGWRGFLPGVLIGFALSCLIPIGLVAIACGWGRSGGTRL